MAQLIEKVELRGEAELTKIQELLEQALERRLQVGDSRQCQGATAGTFCGAKPTQRLQCACCRSRMHRR